MLEPQPLDNLRRHHLIQGADIGLKEGIETATEQSSLRSSAVIPHLILLFSVLDGDRPF